MVILQRAAVSPAPILPMVYSGVLPAMRHSAYIIPLLFTCMIWGSGCREADQITRYRVPKQKSTPASSTQEMLVAATEKKGDVYFFKLVGPSSRIASVRGEVKRFLQTVQFSSDGLPTWQLPDGWSETKGTGMRIATLSLDGDKRPPLEMAISTLRQTNPDWNAYLTSNLNRWRGQMGLPPLSTEMASRAFEKLDARDDTIYFTRLNATSASSNVSSPNRARRPSRSSSGFDPTAVRGTPPPDWKPGPVTGMRKACFRMQADGQALEVTVIPAGGDLLANVNRWRGQLKLEPLNQQQLIDSSLDVKAGNLNGKYIAIPGASETILAAIFPEAGGGSWFVKLRGDSKLAELQQEAFRSFVASLRFSPSFQ